MERRHDTLDGIDILAGLTADARRLLAGRCTWRDFKPHQQILGHQEDTRTVLFLTAGKAHATIFSENGKQVTFIDINAGGMFGEWAAIDGKPRSASVEAVTRCIAAAMSAELFWEVLRTEPTVVAAVLKRLVRRLREMSDKEVESATLPVGKRIAAELLRLAEPLKTEVGNAVLFPAPTNTDIASRVATTRETVNRVLREMMEAGIIEKHGRTLVIPEVEKLRRLIVEPTEEQYPSARA
jgi:CRP/FNR family transcriptional regulator, cyclic AMP receptor protein